MRLAIDACVPAQLAIALRALGVHVTTFAERLAMPDDEILAEAFVQDSVLITSDKDFGELVFRDGKRAIGIVLVRFDIVTEALAQETAKRIVALEDGARSKFVILERTATRTRPLKS